MIKADLYYYSLLPQSIFWNIFWCESAFAMHFIETFIGCSRKLILHKKPDFNSKKIRIHGSVQVIPNCQRLELPQSQIRTLNPRLENRYLDYCTIGLLTHTFSSIYLLLMFNWFLILYLPPSQYYEISEEKKRQPTILIKGERRRTPTWHQFKRLP